MFLLKLHIDTKIGIPPSTLIFEINIDPDVRKLLNLSNFT